MCSVLVPCFDVIVIYSCLKLYLGCAIPFGERKPYVDLSDPSHLVAAAGFIGDSCSARPCAS